MHEVLVNRLGGLSLPRKSVVRLTDGPDMTLDVYLGRKTTIQQQILHLRGWAGGAMVVGKLPVRGILHCACSRCMWGLFGHFYSPLSYLSSFSLSLKDGWI